MRPAPTSADPRLKAGISGVSGRGKRLAIFADAGYLSAMTRHLRLEGIENFRDFGDYPTAAGRRLKRGRLYRSAAHGRATDADLEAIEALNLAVIVDLRRPGERERDPARRPTGFQGQIIENDQGEADGDDPWWTFVRSCDLSEEAFRGYLLEYYREAPHKERHIDLFA